ncbi:Peptidyl-prolyl cis-trans isomerase G [Orchesella cincta]|uniref:peptidylprolyl isomerase n=1 Tax=Orchesella cincta TaxID=48709 RepID=A0A1D2MUM6_ORCCI|nr:Peptidyl-prolyl cis-trans isomerase G [Orchesella cincta]
MKFMFPMLRSLAYEFVAECENLGEVSDLSVDVIKNLISLWNRLRQGYEAVDFKNVDKCLESLLICTAHLVLNPQYMKPKKVPPNYRPELKTAIHECGMKFSDSAKRKSICLGLASVVCEPWGTQEFLKIYGGLKADTSNFNVSPTDVDALWNSEGWIFLESRVNCLVKSKSKCKDRHTALGPVCTFLNILVKKGQEFYETNNFIAKPPVVTYDPFKFPFSKYLEYLEVYTILSSEGFIDAQNITSCSDKTMLGVINGLTKKAQDPNSSRIFQQLIFWNGAASAALFLAKAATWNALKSEESEMVHEYFSEWLHLHAESVEVDDFSPLREIIEKFDEVTSTANVYRVANAAVEFHGENRLLTPVYLEVFIRAMTKEYNIINDAKSQNNNKVRVRELERKFSRPYVQLARFFKDHVPTSKDCLLTAFSLNPCVKLFKCLFPKSELANSCKDEDDDDFLCTELADIRDVQYDMVASDNDDLQLSRPDIQDDLHSIIHNPQYKGLLWNSDEEKEALCLKLLKNESLDVIDNQTLEYVNVDYEKYKDLPSLYDPDDDGIEKGYREEDRQQKRINNANARLNRKELMNKAAKFKSLKIKKELNGESNYGPGKVSKKKLNSALGTARRGRPSKSKSELEVALKNGYKAKQLTKFKSVRLGNELGQCNEKEVREIPNYVLQTSPWFPRKSEDINRLTYGELFIKHVRTYPHDYKERLLGRHFEIENHLITSVQKTLGSRPISQQFGGSQCHPRLSTVAVYSSCNYSYDQPSSSSASTIQVAPMSQFLHQSPPQLALEATEDYQIRRLQELIVKMKQSNQKSQVRKHVPQKGLTKVPAESILHNPSSPNDNNNKLVLVPVPEVLPVPVADVIPVPVAEVLPVPVAEVLPDCAFQIMGRYKSHTPDSASGRSLLRTPPILSALKQEDMRAVVGSEAVSCKSTSERSRVIRPFQLQTEPPFRSHAIRPPEETRPQSMVVKLIKKTYPGSKAKKLVVIKPEPPVDAYKTVSKPKAPVVPVLSNGFQTGVNVSADPEGCGVPKPENTTIFPVFQHAEAATTLYSFAKIPKVAVEEINDEIEVKECMQQLLESVDQREKLSDNLNTEEDAATFNSKINNNLPQINTEKSKAPVLLSNGYQTGVSVSSDPEDCSVPKPEDTTILPVFQYAEAATTLDSYARIPQVAVEENNDEIKVVKECMQQLLESVDQREKLCDNLSNNEEDPITATAVVNDVVPQINTKKSMEYFDKEHFNGVNNSTVECATTPPFPSATNSLSYVCNDVEVMDVYDKNSMVDTLAAPKAVNMFGSEVNHSYLVAEREEPNYIINEHAIPRPVTPVEEVEALYRRIQQKLKRKNKRPYEDEEDEIKIAPSVVTHFEQHGKSLRSILSCVLRLEKLSDDQIPLNSRCQFPVKRSSRLKRKKMRTVEAIQTEFQTNIPKEDESSRSESRESSPEIQFIEEIVKRPPPDRSKTSKGCIGEIIKKPPADSKTSNTIIAETVKEPPLDSSEREGKRLETSNNKTNLFRGFHPNGMKKITKQNLEDADHQVKPEVQISDVPDVMQHDNIDLDNHPNSEFFDETSTIHDDDNDFQVALAIQEDDDDEEVAFAIQNDTNNEKAALSTGDGYDDEKVALSIGDGYDDGKAVLCIRDDEDDDDDEEVALAIRGSNEEFEENVPMQILDEDIQSSIAETQIQVSESIPQGDYMPIPTNETGSQVSDSFSQEDYMPISKEETESQVSDSFSQKDYMPISKEETESQVSDSFSQEDYMPISKEETESQVSDSGPQEDYMPISKEETESQVSDSGPQEDYMRISTEETEIQVSDGISQEDNMQISTEETEILDSDEISQECNMQISTEETEIQVNDDIPQDDNIMQISAEETEIQVTNDIPQEDTMQIYIETERPVTPSNMSINNDSSLNVSPAITIPVLQPMNSDYEMHSDSDDEPPVLEMTVGGTMEEAGDTTAAGAVSSGEVLPRCYFDVEIGGVSAGRVVFELFSNVAPRSAENFRGLCTGEYGIGKTTEKPLHFKGTVFHRVIKEFMIQGGDFSKQNGTGGESVYGGTFEDESFEMKHDAPYLLSMANRGKDTNGSQFFILTQAAPHLDGIHVVFGRVIFGQAIVKQIEGLPVDRKSRPLQDVRVADCGELVLVKKKKKDKKPKKEKKRVSESDKSSGELTDSDSEKEKKRKQSSSDSDSDNEKSPKVFCSVKEGTVPPVPENRFLLRSFPKDNDKEKEKGKEDDKKHSRRNRSRSRHRSRSRSRGRDRRDRDHRSGNKTEKETPRYGRVGRNNDGKKVKGRGRVCYRPVSKSRSRSRSKTPPHWRAEARRVISMREYEEKEKQRRQRDDEIRRRQEERQKRHEEMGKSKDDSNDNEEVADSEDKPKDIVLAPDVSEADKAVEELTAQIQLAAATNEGVVYYQHLYRNRGASEKADPEPAKIVDATNIQGFEPITSYSSTVVDDASVEKAAESGSGVDEGLPSKEDEEEELRLRRELLKKRMKDWEDSSSDDDQSHSKDKALVNKSSNDASSDVKAPIARRISREDVRERRDSHRSDLRVEVVAKVELDPVATILQNAVQGQDLVPEVVSAGSHVPDLGNILDITIVEEAGGLDQEAHLVDVTDVYKMDE